MKTALLLLGLVTLAASEIGAAPMWFVREGSPDRSVLIVDFPASNTFQQCFSIRAANVIGDQQTSLLYTLQAVGEVDDNGYLQQAHNRTTIGDRLQVWTATLADGLFTVERPGQAATAFEVPPNLLVHPLALPLARIESLDLSGEKRWGFLPELGLIHPVQEQLVDAAEADGNVSVSEATIHRSIERVSGAGATYFFAPRGNDDGLQLTAIELEHAMLQGRWMPVDAGFSPENPLHFTLLSRWLIPVVTPKVEAQEDGRDSPILSDQIWELRTLNRKPLPIRKTNRQQVNRAGESTRVSITTQSMTPGVLAVREQTFSTVVTSPDSRKSELSPELRNLSQELLRNILSPEDTIGEALDKLRSWVQRETTRLPLEAGLVDSEILVSARRGGRMGQTILLADLLKAYGLDVTIVPALRVESQVSASPVFVLEVTFDAATIPVFLNGDDPSPALKLPPEVILFEPLNSRNLTLDALDKEFFSYITRIVSLREISFSPATPSTTGP